MRSAILTLAILATVAACQMTDAQRDYLERHIEADLAAGRITQEEARQLREDGSFPWEGLGLMVGGVGASLLGVRVWRGGVHNRRGEAPVKEARDG